jgi:secondary thiamine-phosphate synthase enzyme
MNDPRSPQPLHDLGLVQASFQFRTRPRAFLDVTADVAGWLSRAGAVAGNVTLLVRHTSASLVVQENTDPDVRADLVDLLDDLVPTTRDWRHALEGPDDMPAHAKAMLTSTTLTLPVTAGRLQLGTWQAVYLVEHRASAHTREIAASFIGSFR